MNKHTSHIIIEGPDVVGKSTLAKFLCDKLGRIYHHEGLPPKGCLLKHYGKLLMSKDPLVVDRAHLGERVYGSVMRDNPRLDWDDYRVFNRLVTATGSKVILCLPRLELCLERWLKRKGQEYVQHTEKYEAIYRKFAEYFHPPEYITHGIRTDWIDLQETFEALTDPEDQPKTCPYGVIGSPIAKYLFVGEQVGRDKSVDLPFFDSKGSSRYLNDALKTTVAEIDLALTNAKTVDGNIQPLRQIIKKLPKLERVIALGQSSSQLLKDSGIEHRTVDHPQYRRRFHFKNMDDYKKQIRGALT